MSRRLISRAEAAGFTAIVLTVDAPTFGRRLDDIRNGFKLPPHLSMANFAAMADMVEQKSGESKINDQVRWWFLGSLV